jgi:hypothetical protein
MSLITRKEVIALAIKRTFDESLVNYNDIVSAENQYIKAILTEDLYDNIIVSPSSYYIDYLDSSAFTVNYVSGDLTANDTAITGITKADPAVFTLAGHGFINGQEIRINKPTSKADSEWTVWDSRIFVVSDKDTNTFKLKTSLQTEYIKPVLAYYVIYDIYNELFVELSERGIYHLTANNANIISNQTRTEARNDFYRKAQSLSRVLKIYIEDQVEDEVTVYLDYYASGETNDVNSELVNKGGNAKRSNHI